MTEQREDAGPETIVSETASARSLRSVRSVRSVRNGETGFGHAVLRPTVGRSGQEKRSGALPWLELGVCRRESVFRECRCMTRL